MNLTEKQKRWIRQFQRLWHFYDASLNSNSLNACDLQLQLLLFKSMAAHRLVRGFLAQLRGGSNDNFESKLRMLIEIYINTEYILGDDTNGRASAYVLNGAMSRINALGKIIELLEQDQAEAWAAINSIESYKTLKKEKEQEFSALKAHLEIENYSWPNLEQRARTQNLQQLYASVYWFFSEDTHVTSYRLERFLSKFKGTGAFNTNLDLSNLDIEIQTAYASYLELINLCSEKLGFPPQKELGKFKSSEMMIPKTK